MIAALSLLILIVSFIYFFIKLKNNGIAPLQLFQKINGEFRESFDVKGTEIKSLASLGKIKSVTVLISLLVLIIMFLSSFLPTAFTGEHLSGLFLIIHVTFAPLFSVLLALLVLFYANKLKMVQTDFKNLGSYEERNIKINYSLVKLIFWLMSLLSIPLLLSIILILYPIFGTELQELYVFIHRLSAILISVLALMLIYFLLISRKNS